MLLLFIAFLFYIGFLQYFMPFKLFLLSSNLLLFLLLFLSSSSSKCVNLCFRDRRMCHPISVGFTTTYVISAENKFICNEVIIRSALY
jgi:hypothetical protein